MLLLKFIRSEYEEILHTFFKEKETYLDLLNAIFVLVKCVGFFFFTPPKHIEDDTIRYTKFDKLLTVAFFSLYSINIWLTYEGNSQAIPSNSKITEFVTMILLCVGTFLQTIHAFLFYRNRFLFFKIIKYLHIIDNSVSVYYMLHKWFSNYKAIWKYI